MLGREERQALAERARIIRKNVILATYRAQSGHPGGSLSLADIMAVLYFHDLHYTATDPMNPDRDRVVLSKGHAAPVWYATLAEAGFFPEEELWKLRRIDSLLQGHPCLHIPGVDLTTGSLGLGLSGACGIALGARVSGRNRVRVYAILGDGELAEGQVWEAAMAASHFKLGNLTAIIDRNRYQNDGPTETSLKLEPLADKWRGFGFDVREIDGHDLDAIAEALAHGRADLEVPVVIIAHTTKGRGASYLLDKPALHYTPPTREQAESALAELGFEMDNG